MRDKQRPKNFSILFDYYGGEMLVETTQSYDSVDDAKDALEGLKNIPGFLLGYITPGQPKTRLVFLCNCAGGAVSRTQKVVEDLTTELQPFHSLTTAIIQYPRSAHEREQAHQNAAHLRTLKGAISDRRRNDTNALSVVIFEEVKHLESINKLDHLTPDSIQRTMSTWIATGLTPLENADLPTW